MKRSFSSHDRSFKFQLNHVVLKHELNLEVIKVELDWNYLISDSGLKFLEVLISFQTSWISNYSNKHTTEPFFHRWNWSFRKSWYKYRLNNSSLDNVVNHLMIFITFHFTLFLITKIDKKLSYIFVYKTKKPYQSFFKSIWASQSSPWSNFQQSQMYIEPSFELTANIQETWLLN